MRRTADFGWGGDGVPAQEPQAVADRMRNHFMHDDPDGTPGTGTYHFFYGNGQLHVSPNHDYDQLRDHSGTAADHSGPMAVGDVSLDAGRATWHVNGNVALTGFARILKDYTKQVGWKWGGLTDVDGDPIDDSFAPKKSLFLRDNETGEQRPFTVQGKTANPGSWMTQEHIAEIMKAGYKVAEVPGGGNMLDMMDNYSPAGEDYETYNRGTLKGQDQDVDPNETPTGTFRCPECGKISPDWGAYLLHRKTEEPARDFDDDGHFPEMDMDAPLKPHWHDREPTVMPLASVQEAHRVEGFDEYAGWSGIGDDHTVYGAFQDGELLGVAAVLELPNRTARVSLVHVPDGMGRARRGRVYSALWRGLMAHRYASLESREPAPGFVAIGRGLYKWAAGQQPKDMIDKPIPLVYDIDKDVIAIGYPGSRTSDIPMEFTPGGIVEGSYEPGGKLIISTETNMPWTARHFIDLWYWSYPHMQITGLEQVDATGKSTKLAARTSADVGQYIRQLSATDPAAWRSYQALRKAGGKVYVVGGAVRDALLQREPKDIDLMVTGLPPEAVHHTLESLPGRVDLTGKDFGVFRYRTKGAEVEIALPRRERSTGDRRVDFEVSVDHNMPVEDDLQRRDFTVNSMAVDLDDGRLVDPYGGADDIERRRLRTTHPSSFQEDPTRLVRALVASSRHGLVPDEETRHEMSDNAHRLDLEARERIQAELDKLFKSRNPAGAIRLARDTGMLKHLFPEVAHNWDFDQNNPHHNYPLGEHLLNVLENVQNESGDPDLRLAALLHDVGKPESAWRNPVTGFNHYYRGPNGEGDDHETVGATKAEARLRGLKYPVTRIKRVQHLIQHHMFPAFSSDRGARKFLHRVGDDHADDLLTLRWADQHGKGQTPEEIAARTSVDTQRGLVEQVRSKQEPTTQSALSVNGNDLISMGLKPGPEVGRILRQLTDDVIEEPSLNNRDLLLERAQEYVRALPA